MKKNNLTVVTEILVEERPQLSLEELCQAAGIDANFIQDLIEYGILDEADEFDAEQLRRVRTILHLQRDLEVNLPGAALVLDLMDQMEEMRSQLEVFERYWLKL